MKKNVKNVSRRRKLNTPWKNKSILSCLFNPDKELAPVLYATIDQDKKGKLLASLYETKGKTNKKLLIVSTSWIVDGK